MNFYKMPMILLRINTYILSAFGVGSTSLQDAPPTASLVTTVDINTA